MDKRSGTLFCSLDRRRSRRADNQQFAILSAIEKKDSPPSFLL
jgi:hypothetical protein